MNSSKDMARFVPIQRALVLNIRIPVKDGTTYAKTCHSVLVLTTTLAPVSDCEFHLEE